MKIDLSKINENKDYAIYTPSISKSYMSVVSQWPEKMAKWENDTRNKFPNENEDFYKRNPTNISFDGRELNFLDKNNNSMYYDSALYSAGYGVFDETKSLKEEKILHNRDKNNTLLIGDSSGFQCAMGSGGSSVEGFDWNEPHGVKSTKLKQQILEYLERHFDLSMLLDLPTFGISIPHSPLKSYDYCLEHSIKNYEYFDKHRLGKTKYLTVMQGRNWEETKHWFHKVKHFDFDGGWGISGDCTNNFETLLKLLILMRDENQLVNKPWIHILGTSKLLSSCALTSIHRALKENVSNNINVSYDSSTPFFIASKGICLSNAIFSSSKLALKTVKGDFLLDKRSVKSNLPFPFTSYVSDYYNIGDVATRDPIKWKTSTTFDMFSYEILMHNNLAILLQAIQTANYIYNLPEKFHEGLLPPDITWFKGFCENLFKSETPYDEINNHRKKLASLSGKDETTYVSDIENQELFEYEKVILPKVKPTKKKIEDKPDQNVMSEIFENHIVEEITCYKEIKHNAKKGEKCPN